MYFLALSFIYSTIKYFLLRYSLSKPFIKISEYLNATISTSGIRIATYKTLASIDSALSMCLKLAPLKGYVLTCIAVGITLAALLMVLFSAFTRVSSGKTTNNAEGEKQITKASFWRAFWYFIVCIPFIVSKGMCDAAKRFGISFSGDRSGIIESDVGVVYIALCIFVGFVIGIFLALNPGFSTVILMLSVAYLILAILWLCYEGEALKILRESFYVEPGTVFLGFSIFTGIVGVLLGAITVMANLPLIYASLPIAFDSLSITGAVLEKVKMEVGRLAVYKDIFSRSLHVFIDIIAYCLLAVILYPPTAKFTEGRLALPAFLILLALADTYSSMMKIRSARGIVVFTVYMAFIVALFKAYILPIL